MKRKENTRLPPDSDRGLAFKNIKNSHIGHMTAACGGKTSEKSNLKRSRLLISAKKYLGRLTRPHRMAARRPVAYLVKLLY